MSIHIKDLTVQALEACKGEKVTRVYTTHVAGYGIVEIPLSFSKKLAQLVTENLDEGIMFMSYNECLEARKSRK